MKTLYILLFTILITSLSFGQTLLTENFDYGGSAGDLTAVSGGNWTSHSGTTAVDYSTSSLIMASYPSSGIGGSAAIIGSNSQDVNRTFAAVSTGTVYASALVNISAVSSGNYFFHLNSSSFRAKVGAKDDGGGKVLFGIGASSSTLTYGTTVFDLNTTYLIVASYEISTGISDLYVLTAPVGTEPVTPEATNTGSSGTTISAVSFRQSGSIPTANIDGVRVATTWNDIMNDPVAVTPTNHVTSFGTGIITSKTIQLTWTDATGANLPSKYLIVGKKSTTGDYNPASLTDGVNVDVDTDWSDGTVAINVDQGTGNYTFIDLDSNTDYDFKIYPYSEGTGGPKYKTDPTVPEVTNTTTVNNLSYETFGNCGSETWVAISIAGTGDFDCSGGDSFIGSFGEDVGSDDWLISPEIDFTNTMDEKLNVNLFTNFTDNANPWPNLKLNYTTNYTGDPTTTTWVEIDFASGASTLAESCNCSEDFNIDLSAIPAVTNGSAIRLAFHYVSSGVISATTENWNIDNIEVYGTFTLGVNDNDFSTNFKIYPNPTSLGYVNISSKNGEIIKANVFDILGKQVINSTVINNKLDVSNLNTGVYIMRLTQNNATVTKKLIIN